tara:strand:- start:2701 stop:3255 length:555 start_codon:yes stop_codon:yes gene_type:complete
MDTMWKWLTGAWDTVSGTVGDAYTSVAESAVGEAVGSAYDYVTGDSNVDSGYMDHPYYFDTSNKTTSALGAALDFAGGFMAVAAPNDGRPIQHAQANLRNISGRSGIRSPKFKAGQSDLGFTPRVNDAIMKVNGGKNPSIQALVEQMRSYNGSGRTINLASYGSISVGTKTKKPSFAPKYYGGK